MATLEQLQGVLDRGLQDSIPPNIKAEFDEALRRGLIKSPEAPIQPQQTATQAAIAPQTGQEAPRLSNGDKLPIETPTNGKMPTGEPETFLDQLSDASDAFKQTTREALNTATFGLSDIVAGAGAALAEQFFGAGQEGAVAEAFQAPREERQEFEKENPKTAIAASIVGGFVNPIGQQLGGFISGGTKALGKIGRGATGGSLISGLQAAGEEAGKAIGQLAADEEVNARESFDRVARETLIGAGVGGAIPGVVQGGRAGFNGISSLLTRFSDKSQGTRALRKVTEALERDGFTPEQALKRVDELGPEAALLDVGDNSRALAFTAFGIPGKGKGEISKFLRQRQEGIRDPKTGEITGGQVQRIQEHIDDIIPDNFFTQRERLANLNNSAKFYNEAYAANQNIDDPVINRLLKTPSGQRAFKNARTTIRDLQKNLSKVDPELTAQAKEAGITTGAGVGKGLKLEFLDQVKRELFDLEELARTPTFKATEKSRAISKLRRNLVDELDKVDLETTGGKFSKARLLAGDKLANQEALEKGSNFISKAEFSTPEDLGVALAEMSPEARHLFRVGAAQSLKARISDSVSRADATKKLFNIQGLERKIQAAFGDEELFSQYTKFLGKEETLFRAVTDVLGNSKSAERGAALADEALDPGRLIQGFRDIARGDITRGVVNVAGGAKERLTVPPRQSEALAKALTGRDISGLKPVPPPQLTAEGEPRTLQELLIRALASGQSATE